MSDSSLRRRLARQVVRLVLACAWACEAVAREAPPPEFAAALPPPSPIDSTQTVTTVTGNPVVVDSEIGSVLLSQLVSDGAWCWFGDPRAVRVGDATYVSWVSAEGDIQVGQYRHSTCSLVTATLHAQLEIDDHANPSILVLPDRRLMVFYSRHAGFPMYYRVSTHPEDVTAWQPARTVPGDIHFTYPNPIQLRGESNTIYLFWRGANFDPVFATTSDAIMWSAPRVLIDGAVPYVKFASDGERRIHFAFTESHPEFYAENSIHHAYYEGGRFYRADGTFLRSVDDLPLVPSEADHIYDATTAGARAWIWDIALDRVGHPVVVYATFPSIHDHRYRYARWTGTAWEDHEVTPAGGSIETSGVDPYYSGGIVLDHDDPSVVYLSRQRTTGGVHELERWITGDGGATWIVEELTAESPQKNMRPVVPRGRSPLDVGVVWMRGDYTSYSVYGTSLMFATGPVTLALDVRPGSCPNGQLDGRGSLPVAILGSPQRSVLEIDASSVRLAGSVAPLRSSIEDVSGPAGTGGACGCDGMAPDGIPDLQLHFDSEAVAAALGQLETGVPQPLRITGLLIDETPFGGEDCIILHRQPRGTAAIHCLAIPSGFEPSRKITYMVPAATHVRITAFDVAGRLVQRLFDAPQAAGPHTLEWDTAPLPRGLYFLRLEVGDRVETCKVVVVSK